jgi:hypothetical protein
MTRVEERMGFEILLEEPASMKSLWAALVTIKEPLRFDHLPMCRCFWHAPARGHCPTREPTSTG